jgi:hypothetical protein
MKTKPHLTSHCGCKLLTRRLGVVGLLALLCLAGWQAGANTLTYWRFEPSDPTADSSGNGNTLTLTGVTSSTDVAPNAPGTGSAVFDGITSYAVTTGTLNLSNYPSLTIECFVKTNGQSSLGMVYEHSTNNNTAQGGFYFDFNEPGGSVKSCQGVAPYGFVTAAYPKNSSWHHYALVLDQSGPTLAQKVYIDGVLQTPATSQLAYSRPFGDYPFYIGERGAGAGSLRFKGQVDEMRISGRVLPPSGFLIAPPLVNAAIGITRQPVDTTVVQNHPATFSISATLTNGDSALLEYQWRTNGVNVPGATGATFTWSVPPLGAEGAQVSVVISVPSVGGVTPVTSANATLHVTTDTVPPVATAAFAQATTVVGLLFDEVMDPVSATDPTRFTLDGGAAVTSAQLMADGKTVVLGVSPLSAPTYSLSYNVADLAGNGATGSLLVTNMGFTSVNIGSTPPGVLITTNAGGFTVVGGGADIWTANDGFNFVYKQITGDFDMRLRINNILAPLGGSTSTRGGLMVRETLDASSRNVAMLCYGAANNNWVATWRATTGGNTAIPGASGKPEYGLVGRGTAFGFPNAWVRLKRSGQMIAAYYSTNNMDWTQCSTNLPFTGLPATLMVGMASDSVSATLAGTYQYADYQQFFLSSGSISLTAQPSSTNTLAYRPATFSVSAALVPSNLDQSLLNYQWLSNGVPVEGANSTNFTFALPTVADSGTVFRCLVSAPGVAPVTSAAATLTVTPDTVPPAVLGVYSVESHLMLVQFDELLDPNTVNSFWLYSVDGGFNVYNAQIQADGRSVLLSTDGLNAPTFNLTLNGVTDLSGNALNATVVGANAGLTLVDINNGLLMPSQATSVSSNSLTVSAVGTDIFAGQDSFNFVYEWLTNDFDVRVQYVGGGPLRNWNQRGGLMARVDASQGSPNVFAGTYAPTSANNFWVVTERAVQDFTNTVITAMPQREANFAFPNAWLRLKRAGQALSAYESLNGYTWTQLGTNITDLALPESLMVGMASCTISTLPADFQYANFGPTPSLPQLQLQAAGGNVLLGWTTNSAGFTLQQNTDLSGGQWTAVTNAPVTNGAFKQVTLPLGSGAKFFRLVH